MPSERLEIRPSKTNYELTDLEDVVLCNLVKHNLIKYGFLKDGQISVETYQYVLKELEPLGQKMQAALCYAIDYRTTPNGSFIEPISIKHDPIEIFQMLSNFEEAVRDSDEIVLLPACTFFDSEDILLEGEVAYKKDEFGYWYAIVGDREIHIGNINHALWTKEAVKKYSLAGGPSLEHIPIVGKEAVKEFFNIYRDTTLPLSVAA